MSQNQVKVKQTDNNHRSTNYSDEELNLLLIELENCPALVSGEFTENIPTKKHQRAAWDAIAIKMASINMGIERNGAHVRKKWTDLKNRTKSKAREIQKHIGGTGGGGPLEAHMTIIENKVLALIGYKCVRGITGKQYDSNALTKNSDPTEEGKKGPDAAMTLNNMVENSLYLSQENESSQMQEIEFQLVEARPSEITESSQMQIEFQLEEAAGRSGITELSQTQETVFQLGEAGPSGMTDTSQLPERVPQLEEAGPLGMRETSQPIGSTPLLTRRNWYTKNVSTNQSTKRSQKHRIRKRKIMQDVVENFEKEAIDTTKELLSKIEKFNSDFNENSQKMIDLLTKLNENIEKNNEKLDALHELHYLKMTNTNF